MTPEALRRAGGSSRVPEDIARPVRGAAGHDRRASGPLAHTITAGAPTTYDKVLRDRAVAGRAHAVLARHPAACPRAPTPSTSTCSSTARASASRSAPSLVVMLRELGIPARLAVGYAPGERNPFTGLYEVKASDAHAWAEVYFPGVGWQGFDPTADVPLAGDSQIDAAGTGALQLPQRAAPHPGRAARRHLDRRPGWSVSCFALRSVRAGARRASRSRGSWASQRLARLETLGRDPRPTARAERDHAQLRARGSARSRPARTPRSDGSAPTIDAAMFAPDPPDRDRARRGRRARCARSRPGWSDAREPGRPRTRAADGRAAAQATGTPSNTATLTPAAGELGEERARDHHPAEPVHARGVARTSPGSAPASAAAVSASTVPAAISVRSIAP